MRARFCGEGSSAGKLRGSDGPAPPPFFSRVAPIFHLPLGPLAAFVRWRSPLSCFTPPPTTSMTLNAHMTRAQTQSKSRSQAFGFMDDASFWRHRGLCEASCAPRPGPRRPATFALCVQARPWPHALAVERPPSMPDRWSETACSANAIRSSSFLDSAPPAGLPRPPDFESPRPHWKKTCLAKPCKPWPMPRLCSFTFGITSCKAITHGNAMRGVDCLPFDGERQSASN